MNTKFILHCFISVLLCPLLTGCFTRAASKSAVHNQMDWFFEPIAMYKSTTDGGLAVEGTLRKSSGQQTHAYLIIPEKVLVEAHLKTKGDVSFNDISGLSPQSRQELKLQKELVSGFEKIADIPKIRTA